MHPIMRVVEMQAGHADGYDALTRRCEPGLFSHSALYRRLLEAYLGDDGHYLLLLDKQERICGALPAFVRHHPRRGSVLNSLPYYGSNGGFLLADPDPESARMLADAFSELALRLGCVASTLISPPVEQDAGLYEEVLDCGCRDTRIGQLTPLPPTADELMALFHSKTRNMVRKAQRSGIDVRVEDDAQDWRFLIDTHRSNLVVLGGVPKEAAFFDCVRRLCRPGEHYRLYVARLGGKRVAALLLFYSHAVVEYFTPAVVADFRSLQPLSLVIYTAMQDAVGAGLRLWNWGGTHLDQRSLHRFKRRWGTVDRPYGYYTTIYDRRILECPRDELLRDFRHYYVFPFDRRPALLEASHAP